MNKSVLGTEIYPAMSVQRFIRIFNKKTEVQTFWKCLCGESEPPEET